MMRLPRPSFALVLGAAIGCATLLEGGTADAGRIRFSGGARFNGRVHWHGGRGVVRFARPSWRPRVFVGGSVWVGGGYYPRPYTYYYYPEYVPSYYSGSYYPVQPSVQAGAPGLVAPVVAAPAPRPLPTFGIGVSAGGTSIEDRKESSDLSALVRLRLTPGLLIEGELGKTTFENDVRVDRRLGGSLVWELGARNTFAPYLVGGLGVQQADFDGDFETTQQYGELGVGIRLALSRSLHLSLDVRAGARKTIDSNQPDRPDVLSVEARSVAPPFSSDEAEEYTRARLAAILYF
jgi:hypothetical protein